MRKLVIELGGKVKSKNPLDAYPILRDGPAESKVVNRRRGRRVRQKAMVANG